MRCALCSNTENLLVNVVNDHGLILIFCQDCEDTPTLEAAARLAVENEKLRELVDKMKCCMNCKHDQQEDHDPDWGCEGCLEGYTKWEGRG